MDKIFVNKFCKYFASGNIVSHITDHLLSKFRIFQSSFGKIQPVKITIQDYSKYS